MLNAVTIILSLILFCAAIWIVIPSPAPYVWLFSIAAGEWSLWLGAFSLITILLSIIIPISGGQSGSGLFR